MAVSRALLLLAQALSLAVAEMALLTVDPPWSVIFQGESITLRCQGPRVQGKQPTAWYHNDKLLELTDSDTYRIRNARYKQNGRYKCQSPGSTYSNPISLSVSYDLLILQVPSHAVFEGEPLHMRCRGWNALSLASVRYYRDGADITRPYASAEQLLIPQAMTHHSGRYHCSAEMHSNLSLKKRESQGFYVSIRELFTSPVLSVASSAEPLEGSPLNLSCITHLSSYRPHAVLWYLFYRNSTVLRGPITSSEYQVPAVGLADAGSYSCEVQTESSSTQKRSPQVPITIRRVSSHFCSRVRALLLLAALGTLLLGLVIVHVLAAGSKEVRGMKQQTAASVDPSAQHQLHSRGRWLRDALNPLLSL